MFRSRKKRHRSQRRALFDPNGSHAHQEGKPYRPRRLPRLTKTVGLTGFFILFFSLLLIFSFAHVWKAYAVNQICIRLDALRHRQQDLQERLKAQQLVFQDITLYSKIEPLARELLGMEASLVKPVVIAPLQEAVVGFQTATNLQPNEKPE
jgi:cell division protein FtsL